MIFKGEIDAYIKRKTMLEDNIQKAYSLVLGQCTDLLQSKLKQQTQWATIAQDQDAIELIGLIKKSLSGLKTRNSFRWPCTSPKPTYTT
jgi:hypothetical protein